MPFITTIRRNHAKEQQLKIEHPKFELTGGDKVYTAGGYKIHMFTTVGDAQLFLKKLEAPKPLHLAGGAGGGMMVEYLCVAGGGAGGGERNDGGSGGGGGAGGYRSGTFTLTTGTTPVTVGGGGTGYEPSSYGGPGGPPR